MTPDSKEPVGGFSLGVLGLGHVGLPTALGLAELGWTVVGADDNPDTVARLVRGEATFYEPGMADLLVRHLRSGRFRVAPDNATVVRETRVIFVCVGTPQQEDGKADLTHVEDTARAIARHMNGYKLIVEKSTNPVSTAERVRGVIATHANDGHEWDVAVNPEFLREGHALKDFLDPDRIVIGVDSNRARDLLLCVYGPLIDRGGEQGSAEPAAPVPSRRVVVTDFNTAELIKHASNAFLAMKVSFINMVANLCEVAGGDVDDVALGMGMDPRIGPDFLRAGAGFGGYCLPKDLQAFIHIARSYDVDVSLLQAVAGINNERAERLVSRLETALGGLSGLTVAVWGLAFKPGVDDVRDAPSLRVVSRLVSLGARPCLYDPRAMDEFRRKYGGASEGVVYASSAAEAARGAAAVLLLTEWPEFQQVDFPRLKETVATPLIVDGRNFLDREAVERAGFAYVRMGSRAPG